MDTRRLGSSNLEVSTICLGTMMFGDQTDAAEAARIVDAAREAGVNFVDTADTYNAGESERIVGACLAADREKWVLASKVGNRVGSDEWRNHGGYSRSWMMRAVDDSRRRLATDYLDILYLHRDFPGTNIEEAIETVGDLIRSGRIRYFGVSNFAAWRIVEIIAHCRRLGVPQPIVCQPCYNLATRQVEAELIPACRHFGLGVVPYSPLARGVLTGKYAPGVEPEPGSRAARGERRMLQTEYRPESVQVARRVAERAAGLGLPAAHYALAWLLANRAVSALVAGPRTLAQWLDYCAAASVRLGPEEEAFVDSLVPPGHASTPGYTDPQYPVRGRVVAGD